MIYFDNAATTPTLKEALEVFLNANAESFANPSSTHAFGHQADKYLEDARKSILIDLGLSSTHHLLFNSGATEGNNLAIKGVAFHYANRGQRILTSAVEHPSVLKVMDELRPLGFEIVVLPVDKEGKVEPETLKKAMTKETILVSIMAVNNEVGTINDINALSEIVHAYPKAYFHIDATQAIGKARIPYEKADLISFSAHKFGGLKGSGALAYKKNLVFTPINMGGEQEYGFRGGTVNMPSCAAEAAALHFVIADFEKHQEIVKAISLQIFDALVKNPEITFNSPVDAIPYILNFSLRKKKASVVLEALSEQGIYVSSVSACSSKEEPVSYVLLAMGKSKEDSANSIRISFGPQNTLEEANIFLKTFEAILERTHDR
jgi:cysteine desulfurase